MGWFRVAEGIVGAGADVLRAFNPPPEASSESVEACLERLRPLLEQMAHGRALRDQLRILLEGGHGERAANLLLATPRWGRWARGVISGPNDQMGMDRHHGGAS